MKRTFYILAIFLLFVSSCSRKHENLTLNILETTDVHGQIFPYNFVYNDTADHSLAQAFTYIKKVRSNTHEASILLDNGDIIQGDPSVYYYNFVDTSEQHLVSRVFNYMGYDAATVGNHDIEAGHRVYDRLVKEFDFPWLSANAVNTSTGKPYFQPYAIIKRGNVKIAILGLTTPGIPNWLPPVLYRGIEFQDMIQTAKKWIQIIKEKEKPDVIIGLFHAGHDWTYGHGDSSQCCNENATLLVAQKVPGFDLILCGHDHDVFMQYVKTDWGDSVLVIDPGSKARYIGHAKIQLIWNKEKKKYDKHITGIIVSTDTIKPDSDFIKTFTKDFKAVKKYVSDTVGILTDTLDGRLAYFGDNSFIDLIHQVQLKISGAQLSFAAPLGFKAIIPAGPVTVGKMFALYRYENMLYTMRLKGSEIKKYLEYSYSLWYNQMHSANDHLLLIDDNGHLKNKYYNFDNAEGINYTVDVSKPAGERITITGLTDGTQFDTAAYYTVAINSYRGNGGGAHLTLGAGIPKDSLQNRLIKSTDRDIRFYIMQYFRENKIITPSYNSNWKILPTDWAEKAAKRDYKILFSNK